MNKENIFKNELTFLPTLFLFFVTILSLIFDVIPAYKEYSILVQPFILPILVYLYVTNTNSKRTFLNLFLLLVIFIGDNLTLLEIREFHVYFVILSMIKFFILLYYSLLDTKYLKTKKNQKQTVLVLIFLFFAIMVYWILNYNLQNKTSEIFIVNSYMLIFLGVLIITTINYFSVKGQRIRFLFFSVLCVFFSNLLYYVNYFLENSTILAILMVLSEIPIYYFLLIYIICRDKEFIEQ